MPTEVICDQPGARYALTRLLPSVALMNAKFSCWTTVDQLIVAVERFEPCEAP
jgi:hypothetical protein